jgi:hypothetical protein
LPVPLRRRGGVGEEEARQGAGARHRRRVAAEAGRVREEPDEGEAPFVFEGEPDRSRRSSDAVDTDAPPPPAPRLLRLHRRPTVSTVVFPLFSLRRSCFLLCLWVCHRAARAWARRAAVSPRTTPRRALPVKSRGEATPSRAHRMNQSGRELWAALLRK